MERDPLRLLSPNSSSSGIQVPIPVLWTTWKGSEVLSVENLIASPFSPSRKAHFLGRLQPLRIGFLYLMSGFGGSLLSALFIQYGISVGASGALFGLLGSMLSDLTSNWTMYVNKLAALLTLLFIIIINLAVGILPHVDNFAHIGGFVSGFLLGLLFFIHPQFKWLTQQNAPPGRVTTPVKSKHKTYQYVLWVLSLILLIVGFIFLVFALYQYMQAFSDRSHVFYRYTLGLVTLFRGVNVNNHCSWCHYLSCVTTSKWNCKSQNIYCLIICCTFLHILTSALIFDRHKWLLINMIMVAFRRSSLACRLEIASATYFVSTITWFCTDILFFICIYAQILQLSQIGNRLNLTQLLKSRCFNGLGPWRTESAKQLVPVVEYLDLLYLQLSYATFSKATNRVSSANLTGVGSFEFVYEGVLYTDNRAQLVLVAMKAFNLLRHGASKSFIAEYEALRNIKHRNLVKEHRHQIA
ncbi:hypothetical protein DVH24_032906 [Malus domestica]|uniref:RHOMBOID-like protein n=1 Tax=Malus domestica TaxID=3750 RepID=A0A498IRU8_MALDO|nr:hypothetical protein DVH24_032906 [Malus domestica]